MYVADIACANLVANQVNDLAGHFWGVMFILYLISDFADRTLFLRFEISVYLGAGQSSNLLNLF
jgi:hypothetical protein